MASVQLCYADGRMSWDLLSSRGKRLVQTKFLSLSLFSLTRCVRPVADWQLFAGEWRNHDREWHQSRAGKGWLAWKIVHSPHYLQLLLFEFMLCTCRANLFQCGAIDHFIYIMMFMHMKHENGGPAKTVIQETIVMKTACLMDPCKAAFHKFLSAAFSCSLSVHLPVYLRDRWRNSLCQERGKVESVLAWPRYSSK